MSRNERPPPADMAVFAAVRMSITAAGMSPPIN